MMSLWDALRMNMMISYQELVRTFPSTAMNEAGLNPDVIEAALAHSDRNEVRKAYNRTTYLSQRKDLMNWWGNFIYLNSSLYLKKESA